jgi:metal-sulfur cluster biosynthetic enzyme
MATKKDIITVLKTIPDPELNVSLWDLGLIYTADIDKEGKVKIIMTLTSAGCPLFSLMQKEIEEKVQKIKGVTSVTIDLTFDPPWTMDRMASKVKKQLGVV